MFRGIKGYDVQETRRVAREEGIREGIMEGERRRDHASRVEIARRMKQDNMDATRVAAWTGLSEDEVRSL
jgi:predicted transposase/invertase (TIGR01784 family)